jgi:hypothetical protein
MPEIKYGSSKDLQTLSPEGRAAFEERVRTLIVVLKRFGGERSPAVAKERLAKRMGVSVSAIGNWLTGYNGGRMNPSLYQLLLSIRERGEHYHCGRLIVGEPAVPQQTLPLEEEPTVTATASVRTRAGISNEQLRTFIQQFTDVWKKRGGSKEAKRALAQELGYEVDVSIVGLSKLAEAGEGGNVSKRKVEAMEKLHGQTFPPTVGESEVRANVELLEALVGLGGETVSKVEAFCRERKFTFIRGGRITELSLHLKEVANRIERLTAGGPPTIRV